MSWRDEYTERCNPSVVPSGAYPEERQAMEDQFPRLDQRPAAQLEPIEDEDREAA